MSAREIQDQKAIAREMFVQQSYSHANADVSAQTHCRGIRFAPSEIDGTALLNRRQEDGFYEPADTSLLPVTPR